MIETPQRRLGFPRRYRLLAALFALVACAAQGKLVVMHGYADVSSALLWIQAEAPGPIRVSWQPHNDSLMRSVTLDARVEEDLVVVARVAGLRPGERASYRIEGDGDVREGSVRAQPYWRDPRDAPPITIAIGSCFFLADANPLFAGRRDYGGGFGIFDAIAGKAPDLMLWLGDNLYFQRPDFFDPAAMAARHRRQRSFEPLSRLLVATAHVAIWDDHDYGPNNAGADYPLKGEALRLFKRYWANPTFGLPETPGIFGLANYGDVDLVLLDGRYYRSHPRLADGPRKTLFGPAQGEWLRSALLAAQGTVKLVANGSQFWNAASRYEGLHQYPDEQRDLAAFLMANRIEGLIFASGDRHFTELLKIDRPGGYPLYEFTSSPLTSAPWKTPDAGERGNPDVVPGTLVGQRQFGLIRITGPGDDRHIALESYDEQGALLWRHELRASALRFPRKAATR